MEGNHTLEQCARATEATLHAVFDQLYRQAVILEGMVLKPNMVLPGSLCPTQASVEEVADATVTTFLSAVPAAVPGVAFLSGGQSAELASARLNAMNLRWCAKAPWELTFSFSRAIQQPALDAWKGQPSNVGAAQKIIKHRANCNSMARQGKVHHGYKPAVLQTAPQDPRHPALDKGPSTFDVTHVFTLSAIQNLPFDRAGFLRPLGAKLTSGWQILNITTLTTGSPFSVYSGVQQTGLGSAGADRPDQIGRPVFSTSRTVREDYFGEGTNNTEFFQIPIGVPGGTGPNQGVLGSLGRDTFRAPGLHDLDFSLIKDTSFGHRGNTEATILQFRAEFFNVFNLVNFGLPLNIVRGTGFGIVNKTAGTSRQIQFLLRVNPSS